MIPASTEAPGANPYGIPAGGPFLARAFARGLKPPRRRTVAQWADEERFVADESGSPFPGKWRNALTPHLVEPMECLTLSHPAREVTYLKSQQTGFSETGLNMLGQIIVDDPAAIMVVLPTTDEVKKYVKIKLQPMIDATPTVGERVREQKSRDEEGSTTTFKKFERGFAQITGANSSSGLKMITARVLICEEVSEYPDDVDGQGDPVTIAEGRLSAWERYGREKKVFISTPGTKGTCRITAKFDVSDQRVFHLPCPHCGVFQQLLFDRLDKESPEPVYPCAACGCILEHKQLDGMLARGVWVKTYPGDDKPPALIAPESIERYRARSSGDRQPGFFFDAISSPLTSWVVIVRKWRAALADERKMKDFVRQVLARAWEPRGDAPDHEKLHQARIEYLWRRIPKGALFLTGAADVQGNRLEWGVYAWGPAFSSWLIDKGVIEGDPNTSAPWISLSQVVAKTYLDAFGKPLAIDAFGVDTGYLTQTAYRFVRRYAGTNRVFALDGRPGWMMPALGTPHKKDVDFDGKRIGAVMLWPVGTWGLKSELYTALGHLMRGADKTTGAYAPGTAFYGDSCDLAYCEQLTAEQLMTRKDRRGVMAHEWVKMAGRSNEAHDIAVYSRALAHHLGDGLTPEQWLALAAERGAKPEDVQRDLESLWSPALPVSAPETAPAQAPSAETIEKSRRHRDDLENDNWVGGNKDWLN